MVLRAVDRTAEAEVLPVAHTGVGVGAGVGVVPIEKSRRDWGTDLPGDWD